MTDRPQGAALHAAIRAAALKLDKADPSHFTRDERPAVPALSGLLGYRVSAAERDAALAAPKPKRRAATSRPKRGGPSMARRRALI